MSTPGGVDLMMLASTAGGAAGYELERSLRFDSGDTAFLSSYPSKAGNRKTWTWSAWVKRSVSSSSNERFFGVFQSGVAQEYFRFNSGNTLSLGLIAEANVLTTTPVFRDPAAWYHIVVVQDTTASTTADRVKLFVNGVEITDFSSASYPSLNAEGQISNIIPHFVSNGGGGEYFNGYLSDLYFVDGQALDESYFGSFDSSGVWQPKTFSPLATPNNGTVWSDNVSGTPYSYQYVWRQAFDGTYTTGVAGGVASANEYNVTFSGISFSTGVTVYANSNTANFWLNGTEVFMTSADSWGGTTYRKTFTSSDIGSSTLTQIGVDDGITIYAIEVDGVLLIDGNTSNMGVNGYHVPLTDNSSVSALGSDTSVTLPASPANRGMDVIRYIGNGGTQQISGLQFSPDLVWIKNRDAANSTRVYDTLRGPYQEIYTQSTSANYLEVNGLNAFTSDGFAIGSAGQINNSGSNYVAWCWKGGDTSVVNTDGSIESTVSVNQAYGFSVVTYTGDGSNPGTVGHGLTTAPVFIIHKCITNAVNWFVYHGSAGNGAFEGLNTTAGYNAASTAFGGTAPTSSVITTGGDTNASPRKYVDYCWSEVTGYSKFGTYTGNGSAIGPIVTTGFKPKWLLIKQSNTSGEAWMVFDSERNGTNPKTQILTLNAPDASESSLAIVDFLDDGFQLVNNTGAASNATGATYIYAAFAEQPNNDFAVNNIVANANETSFNTVLYSGDNGTQTVSGVGFEPDFVWIKSRTTAGYNHVLQNTVRGINRLLRSNLDLGEQLNESNGYVSATTADGFTVTPGASNAASVNATSNNYVAYCWHAGGTTVSNTDGSITSSVRAKPSAGFSIVSYLGNNTGGETVGHGLGAAPDVVIGKNLGGTDSWLTWHKAINPDGSAFLRLNSDSSYLSSSFVANGTAPGSKVITLGSDSGWNSSSTGNILYCWTSIPGYSSFGQYVGNGSTTGPIINTGFSPAFLMVKRWDSTGAWVILDSSRTPVNPRNTSLYANDASNDYTPGQDWADFLATGFQPTATYGEINALSGEYVYMAFASAPNPADIDSVLDSATTYSEQEDTGVGGELTGNYAILNSVKGGTQYGSFTPTLTQGNLAIGSTSGWKNGPSTISVNSGKWYCEVLVGSTAAHYLGVCGNTFNLNDGTHVGNGANSVAYYYDGQKNVNGSLSAYGAAYTEGDYIGMALDLDAGEITFYKNGATQGVAATGLSGYYIFVVSVNGSTDPTSINFGQAPFRHAAPTGYKVLCSTNLTEPTILKGSGSMDALEYTGDSVDGRSITSFSFSPDFAWIKSRSNVGAHAWFDYLRGTNMLSSDDNRGESIYGTPPVGGYISSFDTNGFTFTNGSANNTYVNESLYTYTAWAWDAGEATDTNNNGTIESQVRANVSAGFSIVSYEGNATAGATVGHGLGVAPTFMIVKNRDATQDWPVFIEDLGNTDALRLNGKNGYDTNVKWWNNTSPSSTVFTLGNGAETNGNTNNMIAYCWTPVAGYSAFGVYTGSALADGPFVYTGFRPAFVLFKNADSALTNWDIYDTASNTYNLATARLNPNEPNAQSFDFDFLDLNSNGFKPRNTNAGNNGSGNRIVYAAFAENPFKISRAR